MRRALIAVTFIVSAAACVSAQNQNDTIKVAFSVDGEAVPCDNFKVELEVGERAVPVTYVDHGFVVPKIFGKLYASLKSRGKNNIDVRINCGKYALDFPGEYPIFISPGEWKVHIDYPPFRNVETGSRRLPESGLWMSSVEWLYDGCEPCEFSLVTHTDIPPLVVERLRKEQPTAWGERAMDVAYALAVVHVDYTKNRDYLLDLLGVCLAKPVGRPPLEDICDDTRLVSYLVNLYWRGDNDLMLPLLNAAGSQSYAVDLIDGFYGDLLERSTQDALREIAVLPIEKQTAICKVAGINNPGIDAEKRDRAITRLRAAEGDMAGRCLQIAGSEAR